MLFSACHFAYKFIACSVHLTLRILPCWGCVHARHPPFSTIGRRAEGFPRPIDKKGKPRTSGPRSNGSAILRVASRLRSDGARGDRGLGVKLRGDQDTQTVCLWIWARTSRRVEPLPLSSPSTAFSIWSRADEGLTAVIRKPRALQSAETRFLFSATTILMVAYPLLLLLHVTR